MGLIVVSFLLLSLASGQVRDKEAKPRTPVPAAHSIRVLDENQLYRAALLELPPDARAELATAGHDTIVVALAGDALALLGAASSGLPTLPPGEARFIKRETHPAIANHSAATAKIIFVILKRHWDAEVRVCAETRKCSHPVRAGSAEIGQSAMLFSNGFITAYKHSLVQGGTLSSSYYSSRGKDHLLLIPLTDLEANFDGIAEQLQAGQAYSSEASQIEVNANNGEARWIVIRVLTATRAG